MSGRPARAAAAAHADKDEDYDSEGNPDSADGRSGARRAKRFEKDPQAEDDDGGAEGGGAGFHKNATAQRRYRERQKQRSQEMSARMEQLCKRVAQLQVVQAENAVLREKVQLLEYGIRSKTREDAATAQQQREAALLEADAAWRAATAAGKAHLAILESVPGALAADPPSAETVAAAGAMAAAAAKIVAAATAAAVPASRAFFLDPADATARAAALGFPSFEAFVAGGLGAPLSPAQVAAAAGLRADHMRRIEELYRARLSLSIAVKGLLVHAEAPLHRRASTADRAQLAGMMAKLRENLRAEVTDLLALAEAIHVKVLAAGQALRLAAVLAPQIPNPLAIANALAGHVAAPAA